MPHSKFPFNILTTSLFVADKARRVPGVAFITGVICLLKQDQQSFNANTVVSSDNIISLLGCCDSPDVLMSHITDTIFIGETFSCVFVE